MSAGPATDFPPGSGGSGGNAEYLDGGESGSGGDKDLLRAFFLVFDEHIMRDERAEASDLCLLFSPDTVPPPVRCFLLGGVAAMLNLSKQFTGEEAAGKLATDELERQLSNPGGGGDKNNNAAEGEGEPSAIAAGNDDNGPPPELPLETILETMREAPRSQRFGTRETRFYSRRPRVLSLGRSKMAVFEADSGVVLVLGGENETTDEALLRQLQTIYACYCLLFGPFARLLEAPRVAFREGPDGKPALGGNESLSSDDRRTLNTAMRKVVLRRFQRVAREMQPIIQRACNVHRETRYALRPFPQLHAHTELPLGANRHFIAAAQIVDTLATAFSSPRLESGDGFLGGCIFFDSTVLCTQLGVLPTSSALCRVEYLRGDGLRTSRPRELLATLLEDSEFELSATFEPMTLSEAMNPPPTRGSFRGGHSEGEALRSATDSESDGSSVQRQRRGRRHGEALHPSLDNNWSPVADPQCSVLFRERRVVFVDWDEDEAVAPVLPETAGSPRSENAAVPDEEQQRRAYLHVFGLANIALAFFVDAEFEDELLASAMRGSKYVEDAPFYRVLQYCERQLEHIQQDMQDMFGVGAVTAGGATHKLLNGVRVPQNTEEGSASYYHFLSYDAHTATAFGSSLAPIDGQFASHVGAARATLNERDDADQVLLRDHSSGIFCRRKFGREVYFQPRNANSHELFMGHIEQTTHASLKSDYDFDLT
jgi:hypothetical protein